MFTSLSRQWGRADSIEKNCQESETSELRGYLYSGKDWERSRSDGVFGNMEWVNSPSFCEIKRCTRLATWRIGYGRLVVELCPRHTVLTMRNKRVWSHSG